MDADFRTTYAEVGPSGCNSKLSLPAHQRRHR